MLESSIGAKEKLLLSGPSIRIELFRHDEKDKAEVDSLANLTAKGKKGAIEAGKTKNPRLLQGYVVASPRERAKHTAALQFFGPNFADLNLDEHDFDTGFKLIESRLKAENDLEASHKFSTDERLNFNAEGHPEFKDKFYSEYNKDKDNRTLDWQKDESDQIILDLADKTHPDDSIAQGVHTVKGFKRMVGDLAEVFLSYFKKINDWTKDYNQDSKNYDGDQLDIFICSHSQNIECLLMKIIEMKEGSVFLENFLKALPSRKSFIGYSEGLNLTVYEKDGEPIGILSSQNFWWEISQTELQNLVAEKDQFNKLVVEKLKVIPKN